MLTRLNPRGGTLSGGNQRGFSVTRWGTLLGRGLAQILFQTGVPTGVLTLAAMAVADWRMGVLALLGAASSMQASALLRVPEALVREGQQGFCGALVGAAAFSLLAARPLAFLVAIVGGAACAPLTALVRRLFGLPVLKQFRLPPTTAPFCTVAVGMYWLTSGSHADADAGAAAGLAVGAARAAGDPMNVSAAAAFWRSILTNISEVVFANSVPAGALILAALFLAGWRVGAAALLGSAVASLFALATHQDTAELGRGLLGYSPVLTAIALATVFLPGRWVPWVLALAGAILTAWVTLLMHALPGPVFTWPYILCTWLMLVAARLAANRLARQTRLAGRLRGPAEPVRR
ncbi:MAG TPA: urea transporter [Micrococcaceae bacterium]|nr:urea transporter [Micrococcaceae bacterium]